MAKDNTISGVAGWLRFLIVIIFIGAAFQILVSIGGAEWKDLENKNPELIYHSGFQHLQMADRISGILSGCVLFYTGFILLKKKISSTVIAAKMSIGVIYPLLVLTRYLVSPYVFMGVSPSYILASDPSIPKDIVRAFIWAAIWVSYLHRSDRVKNTYI